MCYTHTHMLLHMRLLLVNAYWGKRKTSNKGHAGCDTQKVCVGIMTTVHHLHHDLL